MLQPKSKTAEAYEFLENYCGLIDPDHLKYYRWRQDAQALLKKDAASAYLLLGFVCVLCGDCDAAVNEIKKSYNLKHVSAPQNYVNVLRRAGEFTQSMELAFKHLKQNPHQFELLQAILVNATDLLDACAVERAFALYKGEAEGWLNARRDKIIEDIQIRLQALNDLNIKKESFIQVNQCLERFLSQHYLGGRTWFVFDEYNDIGGHLRIQNYLQNVSIENCLRLNDLFLDVMIENLDFDVCQNILVDFIPQEYLEADHVG